MSETKFEIFPMSSRYKLCMIFLLIFVPAVVYSQQEAPKRKEGYSTRMERFRVKKKDFKKLRYFSAGASLNLLTYFGDLAPANNFLSTEINQIKPGIGAFIQYRFSARASLKAELLYGRLTGDDFTSADPGDPQSKSRYIRNLSFKNDILDFSLMPQLYLFKNYLDFRQRKSFNIYINAGISIFYHNPQGKVPDFKISGERYHNSGEWVALRPLGTEGQFSEYYDVKPYSRFQFSIPFGGGINFRLSDYLDLTFEINYRILLTDYIDDVSGKYVDLGALDSDLAKSMSYRSLEENSVMTGEKREISDLVTISYTSKYDGNRYHVTHSGGALRGGSSNDTYLVTGIKIAYILNKSKSVEN